MPARTTAARPVGASTGYATINCYRRLPGVEELDFVGPWEIFSYLRDLHPETCSVFTVSEHGGEVRCHKGLRVLADYSFDNAPKADILLVPGGMGTRTEVDNPRLIDYI